MSLMSTDERERASNPGGSSAHAAPLRVLHVVSTSLPQLSGYTLRTQSIVRAQVESGRVIPTVVVSPRRASDQSSRAPNPLAGTTPGETPGETPGTVDGVPHLRIAHPCDLSGPMGFTDTLCAWSHRMRSGVQSRGLARTWAGRRAILPIEGAEDLTLARRFRRELTRIVGQALPDVIHAHSPYRCGLAAIHAGRRLGIPVVYEVRGLWEESAVAEGRFGRRSIPYRYWRCRETLAMRRADAVIVICDTLREEIISRGIAPDRIFVSPNGVDAGAFKPISGLAAASAPQPASHSALRSLPGTTIGYVGSVRRLEGIDETVRGVAELRRRGADVSLLVVGDGPGLDDVRRLAASLGLGDRAEFTGRVPHESVRRHLELIDIFAVTRPALRVTELVTPLKPLEAMAMGKALVVSDLPALREIVRHGETGLTYRPGDLDDFARQCTRLMTEPRLRDAIGAAARRWVESERGWTRSVESTWAAYRHAMQRVDVRVGPNAPAR